MLMLQKNFDKSQWQLVSNVQWKVVRRRHQQYAKIDFASTIYLSVSVCCTSISKSYVLQTVSMFINMMSRDRTLVGQYETHYIHRVFGFEKDALLGT